MNKVRLLLLLAVCTLLLPLALSHAQSQRGQNVVPARNNTMGRYYSLLIGVQHYRHAGVPQLDYPLVDVEQVRQVLTTAYSFDATDVTVLKDPNRTALMAELQKLENKLTANDNLLIFYAGHGHWNEQRQQGYWLPSDAEPENRANWISNSDLREAIRGIKAKHTLLISDACFSGSLFVAREAFPARSAAVEEATRYPSRAAMTSGALTTVPDKSVFVRYLLQRLRENQEPYLLAGDLFRLLRTPVINNSPPLRDGTRPVPKFGVIQEADDEGGEFVFVRRGNAVTVATASIPNVRMSVTGVPLRAFNFETVSTDANGAVKSRRQGEADGYTENINRVALELVEVPGGKFTMGSPTSEANRNDDEVQHEVTVSGFMMGKYEVTQAQWAAVAKLPKVKINMPSNPAIFKGATLPVENISWEEASEFCARLSRVTNRSYRLPTEAEWEYAARAGSPAAFAFGETVTPEVVNYDGTFPYGGAVNGDKRQKTTPVGSLNAANAFGLYDLHGNVYEWCQDWYAPYATSLRDNPTGPANGEYRVVRGGSWFSLDGPAALPFVVGSFLASVSTLTASVLSVPRGFALEHPCPFLRAQR